MGMENFNQSNWIERVVRGFLALAVCIGLAACGTTLAGLPDRVEPQGFSGNQADYAQLIDGPFVVDAVRPSLLGPDKVRSVVPFNGPYIEGTVIVDSDARFLYLVNPGGTAIRYAIGVGREGFEWSGDAVIGRKQMWPAWTPPAAMIARQPELEPYRNGMPGGPGNPLGARALYLFENGQDTLFRLHGTREPWSIGKKVSSGCIRLFNQDIVDLYDRVTIGSRVVVLSHQS